MGLLQRTVNVAIITIVILILAILVYLLWNYIVVEVLHGPAVSYGEIALIMAIISVGVFDIIVFQRRSAPTTT